jgi:hypothetical protein
MHRVIRASEKLAIVGLGAKDGDFHHSTTVGLLSVGFSQAQRTQLTLPASQG